MRYWGRLTAFIEVRRPQTAALDAGVAVDAAPARTDKSSDRLEISSDVNASTR